MVTKVKDISIIGLAGKARSGKDTVAGLLSKKLKADVEAFAGPIREASKLILMMDEAWLESDKETKLDWVDCSYREFAQKLGTEFARQMVDSDFWIKRMAKLREGMDNTLIISDVRFDNEAKWIRSQGGVIIHITREEVGDGVVRKHKSEEGITSVRGDLSLTNDSTLTELRKAVNKLAETEVD